MLMDKSGRTREQLVGMISLGQARRVFLRLFVQTQMQDGRASDAKKNDDPRQTERKDKDKRKRNKIKQNKKRET